MRIKTLALALPLLAGIGITAMTAASAAPSSAMRCTTAQLHARFGATDAAAGSTYKTVVWTNRDQTACTLYGYPGVSYVAPTSGSQVGTAASRTQQHPPRTVTVQPGAHASAVVQLANYQNYPKAQCKPTTVSGLRIYPPGSRSAEYLAFQHSRKACSTSVHQLSVEAVVAGTAGR